MEHSHISSPNLHSVIGYGTFITNGLWKDKQEVTVCLVKDYIRILPEGSWFPYALPFNGGSFYALKFEVESKELKNLDYYEGIQYRFFERVKIKTYLKTKKASRDVKNPSEAPYYDLLGTRSHTPSMGEFGVTKSCYLPNIRINTALLGNIKDTIIFNI